VKWCHRGLIVKFVGDKDSKHYKKKYEIRDANARDCILARSLLTDKVSEFDERDLGKQKQIKSVTKIKFLETVIPKKTGTVVMIIGGSLSGEFGRTIDRDNRKETLHLEVFNLRRDVERIKFDHVCEFNALAADFDD